MIDRLRPDITIPSIEALTPELIKSHADEVRLICLDVDGTLMAHPDILLQACADHGYRPSEAMMVGDQLLKDGLSTRLAGAHSVQMPRRGKRDHPAVRYLQRPIEAAIYRVQRLDFDATP